MDSTILSDWEERFRRYLSTHESGNDGSHDAGHFRRVWHTAQALQKQEAPASNGLVLLAAAYFHDIVSLPKNDPQASRSSWLSAQKAAELLSNFFPDYPADLIAAVQHAIHAHSFSAGISPQTIEAKLLQDADRMEALGAIGIARVFYTAGRLGTGMFSDEDPLAAGRPYDDKKFALDHFRVKLLHLPGLMQTEAGKRMAEQRADYLLGFLQQIAAEIPGG